MKHADCPNVIKVESGPDACVHDRVVPVRHPPCRWCGYDGTEPPDDGCPGDETEGDVLFFDGDAPRLAGLAFMWLLYVAAFLAAVHVLSR